MTAKFNLYDFIANLVPGLTFLWAWHRLGKLAGWDSPFPMSGQLAETVVLIVLSYVTGLMLQALAECLIERQVLFRIWGGFPSARWLLPDDAKFSAAVKQRILDLIAERFKVATTPHLPEGTSPEQQRGLRLWKNQELFDLCYNHVEHLNPRPPILNAQYGLFRCLLTTFALLGLLAFVLGLWNCLCPLPNPGPFLFLAAFFAGLSWLCYARCKKGAQDFAKAVYDLFIPDAAKGSA
jgi:hypothetical protein